MVKITKKNSREEEPMKYRIEYTDGRCCSFANGSNNLIKQLKQLSSDAVADVRKLFKSGASDSVMELYKKYIKTK